MIAIYNVLVVVVVIPKLRKKSECRTSLNAF